jgi:hypothetical protein
MEISQGGDGKRKSETGTGIKLFANIIKKKRVKLFLIAIMFHEMKHVEDWRYNSTYFFISVLDKSE